MFLIVTALSDTISVLVNLSKVGKLADGLACIFRFSGIASNDEGQAFLGFD